MAVRKKHARILEILFGGFWGAFVAQFVRISVRFLVFLVIPSPVPSVRCPQSGALYLLLRGRDQGGELKFWGDWIGQVGGGQVDQVGGAEVWEGWVG